MAGTPIPGAPNNMTIEEAFTNPLIVEEMKKQGNSTENINKILEMMKEARSNDKKCPNIKYKI